MQSVPWKKRNLQALDHTNPANLNLDTLTACFQRYGSASLTTHIHRLDIAKEMAERCKLVDVSGERCTITHLTEIRDLFVPNFYFGCEADDPVNAWAFRS